MKKPKKNQKKKLAAIKRGAKRTQRLKNSREVVAKKRESARIEKLARDEKMNEMMDKILQSQFNR